MKNALTILLLLIGFSACSHAQVAHYVKNGGNDSNTGLSEEQAWATIAKVNGHTFIPGDSILFKSGDTWVVTTSGSCLNISTNSGTADNFIYYGAYGTGAKPIITGRQSVSGWNVSGNWTNASGNIWFMTSANLLTNVYGNWQDRGRLWLNGVEVQKVQSNSSFTPDVSFPWTHNGKVLYVYSPTNPASFYSNIESVAVYGYTVDLTRDYIKIQNLDFQGGAVNINMSGADHIVIDKCNVGLYTGLTGFEVSGCTYVTISDCLFDTGDHIMDTYLFRNTEEGIKIKNGCSDWNIYNNLFEDWGHASLSLYLSSASSTISNIKFHNNTLKCSNSDYGRGFAYNLVEGSASTGNEIYSNYFFDMPTMCQISGDKLKFYNNIIDMNFRYTTYRTGSSYGLNLSNYYGAAENNEIYNNTIMNSYLDGLYFSYTSSKIYKNNLIRNNILINSRRQIVIDNMDGAYFKGNTFSNNLLYKSGAPDVVSDGRMIYGYTDMTVAEWNAMNGLTTNLRTGGVAQVIINNIGGDPLLVGGDPFDYSLSEGSSAIGAGIPIPGIPTNADGKTNIGATYSKDIIIIPPPPATGQLKINIFPNPANDIVNISLEEPALITYIIRFVSISGNLVHEYVIDIGSQDIKIPIRLNSGLYILQVLNNNLTLYTQSLIVIK